jgi:hypothetical protein
MVGVDGKSCPASFMSTNGNRMNSFEKNVAIWRIEEIRSFEPTVYRTLNVSEILMLSNLSRDPDFSLCVFLWIEERGQVCVGTLSSFELKELHALLYAEAIMASMM